jgi:hypothetical protein
MKIDGEWRSDEKQGKIGKDKVDKQDVDWKF